MSAAEAKALDTRLTSAGTWSVSTVTGAMHVNDVGPNPTDFRSYRADTGLGRSVQIVIGQPDKDNNVYVYADTDRFNPNEDVLSMFGHTLFEVLPGIIGFNTSCKDD
jgi:hypothetical protein